MDGSRTALSRFTREKSCEYGLQRCNAYRIQLATNLIPYTEMRPSSPDRGPLVPIAHLAPIMLALVVLGGVAGMAALRRRRAATPAPVVRGLPYSPG